MRNEPLSRPGEPSRSSQKVEGLGPSLGHRRSCWPMAGAGAGAGRGDRPAARDEPPVYRLLSVHRLRKGGFDQIADELGISARHARRLYHRRVDMALRRHLNPMSAGEPRTVESSIAFDMGGPKTQQNLVRVDRRGSVVWRADTPDASAGDSWVSVEDAGEGRLMATSWSGWRVRLNPETGEIAARQFVK